MKQIISSKRTFLTFGVCPLEFPLLCNLSNLLLLLRLLMLLFMRVVMVVVVMHLPLPGLHLVLPHLRGALDPVQFDVQSAGVAHRVAILVAAPKRGRLGVAVGAASLGAKTGASVLRGDIKIVKWISNLRRIRSVCFSLTTGFFCTYSPLLFL